MIVTDGVEIFIALVDDTITEVVMGTGTTAAALTDSVLASSVIDKAVTNDTAIAGQIVYSGSLTVAEGNGSSFTEAGLRDAAEKLVCRRVHSAISKTSSFQLDYTWTIKVVGA